MITLVKRRHVVVVSAVVTYCDKYLLQERVHVDAMGYKVLPGGKLDEDTPVYGLLRELEEELDLIVHSEQAKIVHTDNGWTPDGMPYVMLYYHVQITEAQRDSIKNMEPSKCSGLWWRSLLEPFPNPMWDNDQRAIHAVHDKVYGIA